MDVVAGQQLSARDLLIAHAQGAAAALAQFPALAERLDAKLAEAHRAWPTVDLPDPVFIRHLAEKLSSQQDPVSAFENTCVPDLFLACACAASNERALSEFEDHFISEVDNYLRFHSMASSPDDIKQAVRVHLLLADRDAGPRIAQYTGQGPLGGWLRTVTVRTGLQAIRSDGAVMRRQSPEANPFAQMPLDGRDPELRYLQSFYRTEFEAVLKEILAFLSSRERNLLGMYYLDGVSTEALGALFAVSGRSVRRWIGRINKRILSATAQRLGERFDISTADLGGLMALVESQLDMSLSRILRASAGRHE